VIDLLRDSKNMTTRHHFVDEAGDTTLFGRHGKVLVGGDAVSQFFMVARLEVPDMPALQADMDALRAELLADPLLSAVPSMQAAAGKTALFFHAKDDVPEVRHAVFKLLLRHEMRLFAVVKEKHHLLADVRGHEAANPAYRYKADGHEIYDDLIARLFGRFGEFGAQRHITFAVRGSKPRTAAMKAVLDTIDLGFEGDFGFAPHGHTTVVSSYPFKSAGLQACDYLLWALQRFYERNEERYLQAMWSKFALVLDLDAPAPKTKGKPVMGGVAFNEKHPLTLVSRAGVWNKG
jgi:hypothetical protein